MSAAENDMRAALAGVTPNVAGSGAVAPTCPRNEGSQGIAARDTSHPDASRADWLAEYDRTDSDPATHRPTYTAMPAIGPQAVAPTTGEILATQQADVEALCSEVADLLATQSGDEIAFWLDTSPLPAELVDNVREKTRARYRRRVATEAGALERAA